MFIAAAGGVIVVAAAYSDYSDTYSKYTRHNKYNDAEFRQAIENKEDEIYEQEARVNRLYDEYMDSPSYDLEQEKENMRRELENEIKQDKQKLADIDRMIARINKLELESQKE